MPRRVLRFLAGTSKPSQIAAGLGHTLRCLYYRGGRVRPEGLCKSSWIAEVFEVDERSVKRARAELAAQGILTLGTACQFVLNRHGLPVTFVLTWAGPKRGLSPRRGLVQLADALAD